MSLYIGLDIGTTTITALALDARDGRVVGLHTAANDARRVAVAGQAAGRSEWHAPRIAEQALDCLAALVKHLGTRASEVTGVGLTGQQHGVVVLDRSQKPLTPFINWQDQRGEEIDPRTGQTFVEETNVRLGDRVLQRTGCSLATGYLAVTLYWLQRRELLPPSGRACFIADYVGTVLTGQPPMTDPTLAASSGVFDVGRRCWDQEAIAALQLAPSLFPPIHEASETLGNLCQSTVDRIGLATGIPVFVPIGDQQASFLGSVGDREGSVQLNVGTGAQMAVWTDTVQYAPPLELRPFPLSGNLLVGAVLCGGWSYQLLERFFRAVRQQVLDTPGDQSLYHKLNELAAAIPPGADGLVCEPLFAGTRADPRRRAVWRSISEENFTPAHLARSLLEGIARVFGEELAEIRRQVGRPLNHLVGTGNGLRENPLLAAIISKECGLPLVVPRHREEAAFGAALMAAVGAGQFKTLDEAGQLLRYAEPPLPT